jgi:hypothetical protein
MEAAGIGRELAAPTSEHDGSCPGLVEERHLEVYALAGTLPLLSTAACGLYETGHMARIRRSQTRPKGSHGWPSGCR